MTSVIQRNDEAKRYVTNKLDLASTLSEQDFNTLPNYYELLSTLEDLIPVKAMGFRGIVATAFTGKFLDPSYDPLNDFYACNPRSIFEQGIFYALEGRVPRGKSDPLNVAKNTSILNEDWAKGKRPQKAAQAAVNYLRLYEQAEQPIKDKVVDFFFYKLNEYGKSIQGLEIEAPVLDEMSNQLFANKINRFVSEYPESGTVPQLVIAILLNKLYEKSSVIVEGGDESVFGTNTTSKKPADIWLEDENGPFNLYEVTVKKIDYKRLDDSIQSLHDVGMLDKPVFFICRIPSDTNSLNLDASTLNYKGKVFNFVDISSFIITIISLLNGQQILDVTNELTEFVSDIQRPLSTKDGWNMIFG